MPRAGGGMRQIFKKSQNIAWCDYFIISLAPLPAWHAARLLLLQNRERKRQEGSTVRAVFILVPRRLLKRSVSWLRSPHFQRGPRWHCSGGVGWRCCSGTRKDFLSLNPMRWAFLSRRINPAVAAGGRCPALVPFVLSNVFSEEFESYLRNEGDRTCAPANAQLNWVELGAWVRRGQHFPLAKAALNGLLDSLDFLFFLGTLFWVLDKYLWEYKRNCDQYGRVRQG